MIHSIHNCLILLLDDTFCVNSLNIRIIFKPFNCLKSVMAKNKFKSIKQKLSVIINI